MAVNLACTLAKQGLRVGLLDADIYGPNAPIMLGVADQTGTLAVGKMADMVLWSHPPMSVYARAETVFIDGVRRLDRAAGLSPVTDFELGQREEVF